MESQAAKTVWKNSWWLLWKCCLGRRINGNYCIYLRVQSHTCFSPGSESGPLKSMVSRSQGFVTSIMDMASVIKSRPHLYEIRAMFADTTNILHRTRRFFVLTKWFGRFNRGWPTVSYISFKDEESFTINFVNKLFGGAAS